MNYRRLIGPLVLVALVAAHRPAEASVVDFTFSSTSNVEFTGTGNTFTFLSSGGNGFTTDLAGSLLGRIDGTFTIGAITTSGSEQSAPVSGSGTFVIHDASAIDFTATVTWVDITTDGGAGTLNILGAINLSGMSYAGTDSTLLALLANGVAQSVVSFTFTPAKDLTALTTDGEVNATSYSGALHSEAVPEPGTLAALLAGLPLLGGVMLRRRVRRANA